MRIVSLPVWWTQIAICIKPYVDSTNFQTDRTEGSGRVVEVVCGLGCDAVSIQTI
jgi:hypothetical protein